MARKAIVKRKKQPHKMKSSKGLSMLWHTLKGLQYKNKAVAKCVLNFKVNILNSFGISTSLDINLYIKVKIYVTLFRFN